jgi:hypothetical protein
LVFRLTRNGSRPSSGFAARAFAFVAMDAARLLQPGPEGNRGRGESEK